MYIAHSSTAMHGLLRFLIDHIQEAAIAPLGRSAIRCKMIMGKPESADSLRRISELRKERVVGIVQEQDAVRSHNP